jgi:uncharacterized protein (TIGR03083 family)
MTKGPVIATAHLFEQLDAALVELLESLTPTDWRKRTIVPAWTVHQVAAHLLDTALRRLAICRDGWNGSSADPATDLVDFINRLNASGVEVFGRLSPGLLIDFTRITTRQLHTYFLSLDPMTPASFAVSWAGETESSNWFDVARDFTERWHHQEQIRLATDRPSITTPEFYTPVLETFMRAVPRQYAQVSSEIGATSRIEVPGIGIWQFRRDDDGWISTEPSADPTSLTVIPPAVAWRIFTKGIKAEDAVAQSRLSGDKRLATAVFNARAIIG